MKLRRSAVAALLLLATCTEDHLGDGPRFESSHAALGIVPATEVATWKLIRPPPSQGPVWRYLHAGVVEGGRLRGQYGATGPLGL
jgi:hypothetical protein